LVFDNAVLFYGEQHAPSQMAMQLRVIFDKQIKAMPAVEESNKEEKHKATKPSKLWTPATSMGTSTAGPSKLRKRMNETTGAEKIRNLEVRKDVLSGSSGSTAHVFAAAQAQRHPVMMDSDETVITDESSLSD